MNSILEKIREQFPALSQNSHGRQLIYLDNAATAQKPQTVLDLISKMNGRINANVHRAMYELSDIATEIYEEARCGVAQFIGASRKENIIFTSGCTAAINLVAQSYGAEFLKKGDIIVIGADNHHSNIVPWQLIAQRVGAEIKVLPVTKGGEYDLKELESIITEGVKIVAISHISNILGVINPLDAIISHSHSVGAVVLVDGAQGIVHQDINLSSLDADFYTFSTHKLYGGTGHGVLYGKTELLEKMPPFMGGGDMVDTVTYKKTTYAPLPLKFEAGTPNFVSAASLSPAIKFVEAIRGRGSSWLSGSNKNLQQAVEAEQKKIIEYMFHALDNEVGDVEIYGRPGEDLENESFVDKKIALFSFNIKGTNSSDVAQILDQLGIAVRSGLMCAEPLLNSLGVTGAVRASFGPYNTIDEARQLIEGLKRAKKMLY